jgi:hypothetical protein
VDDPSGFGMPFDTKEQAIDYYNSYTSYIIETVVWRQNTRK